MNVNNNLVFTCRDPFWAGNVPLPCNQCDPCRRAYTAMWAHRMDLESYMHGDNCFLTLTYDDEHLPRLDDGRGTLAPGDVQLFLHRLRKVCARSLQVQIRFVCVGEYGGKTDRPHYHLTVFGLPTCWRAEGTLLTREGRPDPANCCTMCKLVYETWKQGLVVLKRVEPGTNQYVSQYALKKMFRPNDPRLAGRHPEFKRQSNRPGIGVGFVQANVVPVLRDNAKLLNKSLRVNGDVPHALQARGLSLPLGRTLTAKVREGCGLGSKSPEGVLAEYVARFEPFMDKARSIVAADPVLAADPGSLDRVYKQLVLDSGVQTIKNREARRKIFRAERRGL